MAKCQNIDLIMHCNGADTMVHSARTTHNIAIVSATPGANIELLKAGRAKIEGSLNGKEKLKPSDLESYGVQLSDVLFSGTVRQLYEAAASGSSVQISICAMDVQLKAIPWEFLIWPDVNTAPHQARSICRLVTSTQTKPLSPLKIGSGVRIMLVVSQPTDQPSVEWIETQKTLEKQISAYTPESGAKAMEFRLCEAADPVNVRNAVQAFDPHVVHFIGHGAPDALAFTQHRTGKTQNVKAGNVHSVLSARSTRLIVLSACDTAKVGDEIAPLISIAERIVQAGIPAVVANQMPISLRSIHTFCGSLYSELLKSGNIDWAVNAGRIAMGVAFDNLGVAAVEWGVPILYRRPGCSQLFQPEGNSK